MLRWYIEASYNLFSLEKEEKLDLFARYSNYDTHAGIAGSLVANDAYNRNVLTTGLSWHVAPNLFEFRYCQRPNI